MKRSCVQERSSAAARLPSRTPATILSKAMAGPPLALAMASRERVGRYRTLPALRLLGPQFASYLKQAPDHKTDVALDVGNQTTVPRARRDAPDGLLPKSAGKVLVR